MDDLERAGHWADYRGRRYRILAHGDGWVTLLTAPTGSAAPTVPDATDGGTNALGRWARVPVEALNRRLKVSVSARWRGERVWIGPVTAGVATVNWSGPASCGHELGMNGSPHDGWDARVPTSELSDIEVEEADY